MLDAIQEHAEKVLGKVAPHLEAHPGYAAAASGFSFFTGMMAAIDIGNVATWIDLVRAVLSTIACAAGAYGGIYVALIYRRAYYTKSDTQFRKVVKNLPGLRDDEKRGDG